MLPDRVLSITHPDNRIITYTRDTLGGRITAARRAPSKYEHAC